MVHNITTVKMFNADVLNQCKGSRKKDRITKKKDLILELEKKIRKKCSREVSGLTTK